MERSFLLIYLFYGFIYLLFAVRILTVNKRFIQNMYLVKSFKYIALFGLTHGVSEWLTMINVTGLYTEYYSDISNIKFILKMLSFVFLMQFGINLIYEHKIKYKLLKLIPALFAIVYVVIFSVLLISRGGNFLIDNRLFNIIYIRYFLGFFGGMIAAYGILIERKTIDQKKQVLKRRYLYLIISFLIYGIVDGLIVRQADFFPANIMNNQLFYETLGIRVQFIKILVGVTLYMVVAKVIEALNEEFATNLNNIQIKSLESDARSKIGFDLHDLVVQDIYAIKLKVMALMNKNETHQYLESIRSDLNVTLEKTRNFMQNQSFERIDFNEFLNQLSRLIELLNYSKTSKIKLTVDRNIQDKEFGKSFSLTHGYLIVQETTLNAYKHAQAQNIDIKVALKNEGLAITVQDDGVGVDFEKAHNQNSFGILSMKKRIEAINGKISISNNTIGTKIEILVPLERNS